MTDDNGDAVDAVMAATIELCGERNDFPIGDVMRFKTAVRTAVERAIAEAVANTPCAAAWVDYVHRPSGPRGGSLPTREQQDSWYRGCDCAAHQARERQRGGAG